MCAKISFFRIPEHRVYNYSPRYYDPRKERAEERASGKADHYIPGSLIHKAYRNQDFDRREAPKKSPLRFLIGFCTLVAAMLAAYFIAEGLVKILQ